VIIFHGGFRHIEYIPPQDLALVSKLFIINEPFGIMSATFGKTSVAFFLINLLGPQAYWQRTFLYINIVLYFTTSFINLGVLYGQCSPTRALWDAQLIATGQAHCLNPNINTIASIVQGCKLT
jgi:hypothetical protein